MRLSRKNIRHRKKRLQQHLRKEANSHPIDTWHGIQTIKAAATPHISTK